MRLIFMGTPETAVPTLRRCLDDGHEILSVWTQPDRPAGRGNKIHVSPVKEFALERGLTVHQPEKIRTDAAFECFSHKQADAGIVVAYGRILPHAYLNAPLHGCVNVHFSLLPKYRGAAPVNWAVVRGEQETGVTTMQMDEGLDTGPILLQKSTPINDDETAPELLTRLAVLGAELLSETLARIDEINPQPQDGAQATLAPILRREDGLIDWSAASLNIERCVRGFQPWPNAYTFFEGKRLVVWRAEVVETKAPSTHAAGEVVAAKGDEFIVGCGEATLLRLVELQPEGKRRMAARDFINGAHIIAGSRLG